MTTTRPTFSTITVSYKLSTLAAEQLGDDALSVYETALTAALVAEYPGAEVDVDVRLANVDASTFEATCETTEGVEAQATFTACQSSPDYGVRLATGEVFHVASLDAVRAEAGLLAAVDALARPA